ncbi:MAG: DUF2497 domain-containing protein [Alphaproteobacteria bacterium]|nr:DUF2497 domain-containing protein [Alphaproteobacteria bacterium]MBE8220476.1 DUF2497 domain-containing protein [Alphaproteobacteria bacterium]
MAHTDNTRQSIAALLAEAETRFSAVLDSRTSKSDKTRTQPRPPAVPALMQGLDLTINEEALIALSAAFARAGAFDNDQIRTTLEAQIGTITAPLIQKWIDENLPNITREVVREALGNVSKVRPYGLRPSSGKTALGTDTATPQIK